MKGGEAEASLVMSRRLRVTDAVASARAKRWPAANVIRAKVLGRVVESGAAGATAPEIAASLAGDMGRSPTNRRRNLVAGRLVELATIGLVKGAGVDRGGWKVWVAATAAEGAGETNFRPARTPLQHGPSNVRED